MKIRIFLLLFISTISISAQKVENTSFKNGEKLVYTASYYMSSLWTDIAEVTMSVSEVKASSQTLYKLKCTASTFQSWDSFFKIRDLYQSYVDKKSVKPFLFKANVEEGSYTKNVKYIYKWKSGLVNATTQKRKKPAKQKQVKVSMNTYDLVSVLYMVRNLDFSKKQKGETTKVKVLIGSKVQIVTIKYMGSESIKVSGMGYKECDRLAVFLKNDKILKGKDLNNIWITKDQNKVPVLIKAKIPVGSVQVRLKSAAGLRNKN